MLFGIAVSGHQANHHSGYSYSGCVTFYYNAECHYVGCRYAECRGALMSADFNGSIIANGQPKYDKTFLSRLKF
jgi:hypothetical protein